ncbi:hypothetical protein BDP27DRAFT_1325677 [Rhodocollybia butyracea]|uniref:Uncharacterized protein n=1 Tax=Rhodocollybia butyracea TaxID=206335 RepID=A0A9P5PU12_9AGAR|nr:hypothetical protein BDP27DRAFT_1325677 [Rhodocollybia butyracea]
MSSTTLSSAVRSLAQATFSKSKANTPAESTSVDKDTEVDSISDSVPSLSSSFPSFDSFKDRRAYEHDRQRRKRSEEFVKKREARSLETMIFRGLKGDAASMREKSIRKEKRIEAKQRGAGAADDEGDVIQGVRSTGTWKEPSTANQSEVKLADLITPGSIRKSRKNKDSDFEVIPAVRSVIVLDELAFMQDTPRPRDLEQDWEHVYHSDGDDYDSSSSTADPNLTYAKVVLHGLD